MPAIVPVFGVREKNGDEKKRERIYFPVPLPTYPAATFSSLSANITVQCPPGS
jgi:hypothetical protein